MATKARGSIIKMETLQIGERKLRYIRISRTSLQEDTGTEVAATTPKQRQNPMILFFGSDVLSRSSVSSKNLTREHFNRSKTQQCCKITFTSRLLGVTGQAAWFYDVKGLFNVAFQCYNFEEQRSVVKCLFTEWNSAGVGSLPTLMSLSYEDIVQADFSPIVIVEREEQNTGTTSCALCQKDKRDRALAKRHCQKDACVQTTLNAKMVTKATQSHRKLVPISKACQTDIDKEQRYNIALLHDVEENRKNITENSSKPNSIRDDSSCSQNPLKRKSPDHSTECDDPRQVTGRFLNAIATVLKDYYIASSSNIFFFKIYILFETFLFIVQDEQQVIEETTTGVFPFHLMSEYMEVKKQYRPQYTTELPANVYFQDVVLQIYSKWLGAQYHKFQSVIAAQIDEYKKVLISQNKFLPSAVKLFSESNLYPSCMVEFLNLWLHGGDQQNSEEQSFNCSKILLVLELINDNLITGVGHVVYAKLKSADSI